MCAFKVNPGFGLTAMAVSVRSRIVQVTNISPSATTEQLRTLFGHVGVLEEFVMYPPDDKEEPASKVTHDFYGFELVGK